jgi:glutathione S-transferase
MELKFSPLSPYVRKVMVVAHEVGVADRIQLTPVKTREEPEKITPVNPLGKIPALITDAGQALFDSPVICEYLDAQFGGRKLLPAGGDRRWAILTMAALADGILDAALLVRHERARPAERQSSEWIELQMRKINSGLDALERQAEGFGSALDLGLIGVGCVLGYLPLRIEEAKGLPRWPHLKSWYASMSPRPSFERTTPVL